MNKRLLIISHAYLRDDVYKSLLYLKKNLDVFCLVPKKFNFFRFSKKKKLLKQVKSFYFNNNFFFKENLSFINNYNPEWILIEYNPWSLIFLQIIIYCKIRNIKSKIIVHIKDNKYNNFGVVKKLIFYIFKNYITSIWFASSFAKKNFNKFFRYNKKKIQSYIIPIHPIDTHLFKKKNKIKINKIKFGFIGRPDNDKGFQYLIDTFKLKVNKNNFFYALLPEKKFWKNKKFDHKLIKNNNIQISIKKFNTKSSLNFIKKIDVLFCPSIENFNHAEQDGQVLLENLSCNNICVSSNSGFFKNIKKTDSYFKINNVNINSISNIMKFIKINFDEIKFNSNKNRILVNKNFSIEIVIKKKISILKKI